MQIHDLIKYIKNPQLLQPLSIDELEQLEKQHPYFQTVKLLTLKHAYVFDKSGYQSRLHKTALYITDRRILYELIFPLEKQETSSDFKDIEEPAGKRDVEADKKESAEKEGQQKAKDTLQQNISELLTGQLTEMELIDPDKEDLATEIAIDINKEYEQPDGVQPNAASWPETSLLFIEDENLPIEKDLTSDVTDQDSLKSIPEILEIDEIKENSKDNELEFKSVEKDAKPVSTGSDFSLIDKFIRDEPRLVPKAEKMTQEDISENSIREHDGFFTETLAKIYLKQGYYSKAIFTYEKLSLKYPEKSNYFADLINKIKK